MKKKYTIATSHFAEPSSSEPEQFFGYFNTFITQFLDGKDELQRRREEEERKRVRVCIIECFYVCTCACIYVYLTTALEETATIRVDFTAVISPSLSSRQPSNPSILNFHLTHTFSRHVHGPASFTWHFGAPWPWTDGRWLAGPNNRLLEGEWGC